MPLTGPVSSQNRTLKVARALRSRHGRDKHQSFLVEGVKSVQELITSSPGNVTALLVNQRQAEGPLLQELLGRAESLGISALIVEDSHFSELVDTPSPQGIVAVVKDIAVSFEAVLAAKPKFTVIADGLQDPGNMGTLVRLSDAVGADAFVATSGSVDLFNPKVVRASMGSVFHLTLCKDVDAATLASEFNRHGTQVVAADPYGKTDHFDLSFVPPLAVVFGNEGAGLSAVFHEQAQLVRIPMPGKAESLNVGVAAGILLYEIVRQWRM